MANFICPFSKKVCNPSCRYWEFDSTGMNKRLMGIIPINFTMKDILTSGLLMNQMPLPLTLIIQEYQKYYDLYHPEQTNTPKGRCLKIEEMNAENDLTNDEDV